MAVPKKEAAAKAKGTSKAASSGKGGGDDGDGGDNGDADDGDNLDDNFTEVWSTSCKMRASLKTIISDSTELSKQVSENEDWAWARNEQNIDLLGKKVQALLGLLSAFHREFLTCDVMKLKKAKSKQFLIVELTSFLKLQKEANDLKNHLDRLVKAHHAMKG